MRQLFKLALVTIATLFTLYHTWESCRKFPPTGPVFTVHDHPFHFYYLSRIQDSFAQGGSFCYYDPTFMAGYAKTLAFPTSSSFPELLGAVAGHHRVLAYRLYVFASYFLAPFILALATFSLRARLGPTVVTFVLGVIWLLGWPSSYIRWGMSAFILTSALSILAAVLIVRWLVRADWSAAIWATIILTISTIGHPSTLVTPTLIIVPCYLAVFRKIGWKSHLYLWLIPAIVAVCWSPWWYPTWVLRATLGTTASGFINEQPWVRMVELLRADFPIESGLLVLSITGLWWLRDLGRPRLFSITAGLSALFCLAYFVGAIPSLWFLQPGRYTQPFYAYCAVAAGCASGGTKQLLPRNAISRLLVVAATSAGTLLGVALLLFGSLRHWHQPALHDGLPESVSRLVGVLQSETDSSGRILFEDRGRVSLGPADPYGSVNPAALLPILAPGQYIGGPYLYTHLKTNFTQVGDYRFFSKDLQREPISLELFLNYARLYNIRWAVIWSPPLRSLAARHPEVFQPVAQIDNCAVLEIVREPQWAIRGSAKVNASINRISVADARPDSSGLLVLSYHWVQSLRSSVPLHPVRGLDDPVPFIGIKSPPKEFVIEHH